MGDLSAANCSISFVVPGLFTSPENLTGFASDDVYDLDEIENIETLMGVDGVLSGGWVWKPQPHHIMLQADSPSCAFFDAWNSQQAAALHTYPGLAVTRLPQLGLKMIHTVGFLTGYKLPGAKKLVQPRRFRLMWNQVLPAPV
jgi:hypothetical protein